MEFIEKKVKRRTPVKVKTVNYKDFEINYIEMKSGYVLDEGTEPGEIKFNIFDHQPRKRNDSSR